MYIATGQGQRDHREQNFDVNRKALSLFIHVYSPGAGADNPLGTEF